VIDVVVRVGLFVGHYEGRENGLTLEEKDERRKFGS
jgi:hypothetical protein